MGILPRENIVTIAVADLERSLHFYRDGLGVSAEAFRLADDHIAIELQPGLSLVLFPRQELAKLAGQETQPKRSREVILSYPAESAAEVDQILERAEAAGATIPSPPSEKPWGYCRYFVDPDGHLWELLGDSGFASDRR